MFPIPWNRAFRKKDGSLVNIADAMSGGGGGSELPEHSAADAGKVLKVADDGSLEWSEVQNTDSHYTKSKVSNISANVNTYAKEVL